MLIKWNAMFSSWLSFCSIWQIICNGTFEILKKGGSKMEKIKTRNQGQKHYLPLKNIYSILYMTEYKAIDLDELPFDLDFFKMFLSCFKDKVCSYCNLCRIIRVRGSTKYYGPVSWEKRDMLCLEMSWNLSNFSNVCKWNDKQF